VTPMMNTAILLRRQAAAFRSIHTISSIATANKLQVPQQVTLQQQQIQRFQPQIRNAHTVRVILTKDLPDGKGYSGEVHNVKSGYARNHLIPLKKALYATPINFDRAGIPDPDLRVETDEERRARESAESDEDLKAADFLRYYLRNKTLKIWRMVDLSGGAASGGTAAGVPIHPGMVDHEAVRAKLSKQLQINLEDHEIVQIHPEQIPHHTFEEDVTSSAAMEEALDAMEPLKEGEECKVVVKTLGEYLVKIHLRGGQRVGLRLAIVKR